MSTPLVVLHPGCPHPVQDHTRWGCIAYRCPCMVTRRQLAGPTPGAGWEGWVVVDWVLRGAGLWWLAHQVWALLT
jgi:hypothetical protein